jgi:hypothetical protein
MNSNALRFEVEATVGPRGIRVPAQSPSTQTRRLAAAALGLLSGALITPATVGDGAVADRPHDHPRSGGVWLDRVKDAVVPDPA